MNLIFNQLRTILYEKFSFHFDQVELTTKLELELGIDSREMFELLDEVEKTFQVNIDLDEIDNLLKSGKILTINDIVQYIEEKQGLV